MEKISAWWDSLVRIKTLGMPKTSVQYLEEKVDALSTSLSIVITNHLPHIQASMTRLEANYEWIKWLLFINVGLFTTSVGLLIKIEFFK